METSILQFATSPEDNSCIVINTELKNHIAATEKTDGNIGNSSTHKHSGNARKGKTIPGFAREVIVKVAEICEHEANQDIPLFSLNAPTKRAAVYTGVSERTIQRIRAEDRKRKLAGDKEDIALKKSKVRYYPEKDINSKLKKQGHRGQVIPSSARDIISRVIASCYREFEDGEYLSPLICKTRRTALYTGVSVRTIQRIKQEDEVRNKGDQEKLLSTPGRKRKRTTFRDKIDDFDFHCIRMLIDDLLLNKKVFPTCSFLLKAVKDSGINFPYGEDTLFRLLHSKGFNWRSSGKGKKVLVEKENVFQDRVSCIREIKKQESEGKFIIYLDDRWIGVDEDNTYRDKNNIFGAAAGTCCSGRIVALTEFSAMGMARRAFKSFRPNSKHSEYADNMPIMSTVEKWMKENLFPNIPAHSLVVMSTNAYDQRNVTVPNEYSTKATLIDFLKRNKLKYDRTQTWADLYDIIKNHLESLPHPWSNTDKIIEKHGHSVLRLPVYMSEFNPIELAFADINRYLQEKITPPKASLIVLKDMTLEAVESFQIGTLQRYVNHVINIENYFLEKQTRMQEHYDSVIKKENVNTSPKSAVDNVASLKNAKDPEIVNESNTGLDKLFSNNNLISDSYKTCNLSTSYTNFICEDTISSNIFVPVPHSQIFYGKTVATPVLDKSTTMYGNLALESNTVQTERSYLNL